MSYLVFTDSGVFECGGDEAEQKMIEFIKINQISVSKTKCARVLAFPLFAVILE